MWSFGKRILRYLKQTMNDSLTFTSQITSNQFNTTSKLVGFCDASWADDKSDRRSTYGYCVYFNGNCVSWTSRKQESVALSTCEAEFIAIAKLLQELLFFKQLLNEMFDQSITSMIIYTDNQSAINLSSHSINHIRSKHIDIKLHFIRDHIKSKSLQLQFIDSQHQTADIFTKPLNRDKLNQHKFKLNLF